MNQIENNGRIAGVHVATLLRNLEESTIDEGSDDLYCRCKDAFAVLDSLLGDDGPRAGLYSLLSEESSRAANLAEAAALLPTIMADAFQRDDCSEEFLNGMAYGVASYCSAIKALAAAQSRDEAPATDDTQAAVDQRQQQAEWSRDVQSRLIDACTEQDAQVGNLMAEAACLLLQLEQCPESAQELHTGIRATDVAQVLNDLERAGREDAADVCDIAGRAAAVIKGLLNGLSASQLSGINGARIDERAAAASNETPPTGEVEWTRS